MATLLHSPKSAQPARLQVVDAAAAERILRAHRRAARSQAVTIGVGAVIVLVASTVIGLLIGLYIAY